VKRELGAKWTGFWLDHRTGVDNALVLSSIYQAELTGSISLHHIEMTSGNTDGFLAVGVCSNLAFLGSSGYWSACHYEGPGSDPGKIMWDIL
jgi:hypothetical protein